MTNILPQKSFSRPWLTGAIALLMLGSVATYFVISQPRGQTLTSDVPVEILPVQSVMALGRLEPQGEVIKLSVANAQDSRVNQLLVEE